MYNKKQEKSIYFSGRIDWFILFSTLILIVSPVIYNIFVGANLNPLPKQTVLYVSSRFEEIFGREITETIIQEFVEKNPGLQVKTADSQYQNEKPEKSDQIKIIKPDILIFDEGGFSALAAGGMLAALEDYVSGEASVHQLAIPLVSFMDLLFYNIKLLEESGFDRPPKTREEFLACAKTVSGRNSAEKAAGFSMGLSPNDGESVSREIFSWIWASGGDFLQEEDRIVINTRQIIRDISFLDSLYRDGALSPANFEMTGDQVIEEFSNGKIALMIASTRVIPVLREKMGDDAFGITTIPDSGFGGKYSAALIGIYAGISSNCQYPDAAWSFIEFLAGQSPLLCAKLKAVPGVVSEALVDREPSPAITRLAEAAGDYFRDDVFYSKARDIFESSKIVHGFTGNAKSDEYEGIVREEMTGFFESRRTAQETAVAIQNRWDEVEK